MACRRAAGQPTQVVGLAERFDLALADGQAARLAGIHLPARTPREVEDGRAILSRWLLKQAWTAIRADAPADRWGRSTVDLVDAQGWPLAARLVAEGSAVTRPGDVSPGCVRVLLRLEQEARRADRGRWAAGGSLVVMRATDLRGLRAVDGQFTIVAGRVRSASQSRGTLFLNFGTIRRQDFSVAVSRRNLQRLDASGMTEVSLVGRWVRVRGVMTGSGTPRMDLAVPEQIERLD